MFRRKLTTSLLICFLASGGVITSASANENVNLGPSGDSMTDLNVILSLDEQKELLLKESTSKAEEVRIKQKFEDHDALVKRIESGFSIFGSNTESGSHAVPYFKQAYDYYCGPATVKQTIHFIKGSSGTQDAIATSIGTTKAGSDLAPMVKYLNNNQTVNTYVVVNSPSEDLIKGIPEYAVRKGSPAIGRLKIAKGGNWAYSSAGHFMNMSGYTNYGAKIRVTDPYIGWINASSTGSYYVTSNEFYTATKNHFANQIAY